MCVADIPDMSDFSLIQHFHVLVVFCNFFESRYNKLFWQFYFGSLILFYYTIRHDPTSQ